MKERGILMSGMNIAPILADIKIHTRRAMKSPASVVGFRHWHGRQWEQLDGEGRVLGMVNCPHGEAGDRLWVREAWRTDKGYDAYSPAQIDSGATLFMLADNCAHRINTSGPVEWGRYRHARFMPRWASRILLEITEIRVERLQDISEADAKAEGIRLLRDGGGTFSGLSGPGKMVTPWMTAIEAYCDLWESINGPGSWAENPFVWVIIFRRIK